MSQASNELTIPGSPLGGAALVTEIQDVIDALASSHKGSSRPTYVTAGMTWVKEVSATQWDINLYDGGEDIVLTSINPTDNSVMLTAAEASRISQSVGPVPFYFKPHEQATPDMTVRVDAGILNIETAVTAQSSAAMVAPGAGNGRIDRIVIDETTGTVAVITGVEAPSPVAPALSAGKLPVCSVLLDEASTSITDSMISDERPSAFNVSTGIEVGSISFYPFETPPTGYLECDGATINRTTYSALFAAIGTVFGSGDGSTTFAIPDLRGQFIRAWDHGAGIDPDAGSRSDSGDGTTGDQVGTKQADEFKLHYHGYGDSNDSIAEGSGTSVKDATNDDDFNTTSEGGNETRPTNIYLMPCIKY